MKSRSLLALLPLALFGCSKTPEEQEAAKFPPPKMMSEAEGKQYEQSMNDPRKGGQAPAPGATGNAAPGG